MVQWEGWHGLTRELRNSGDPVPSTGRVKRHEVLTIAGRSAPPGQRPHHCHLSPHTPPPHPLTTDPVLSGTLWPEGQAVVRWAGGRAGSSPSGSQELAGGNQWPWGVTCHGTQAKAHTCTQPSAHPHRSHTLAPPVGTAGQPLGTAGLESGTAGAPTLCYQCKTSYLSVF